MNKNNNKIVIFITAGSKEEAVKIGKVLVKERLVACCNILSSVNSIFWWHDEILKAKEVLLIAKSSIRLFDDIVKKVKEHHSYIVPEIIAIPIIAGSQDYLDWIENEIKGSDEK